MIKNFYSIELLYNNSMINLFNTNKNVKYNRILISLFLLNK